MHDASGNGWVGRPASPPPPRRPDSGARQPPPAGPVPGPDRDESTRLLCAAAHLDGDFANDAIAEFLSEPLRATAPSPGVDSRLVLRDAVAASVRRRWRDGVLAVLLLIMAGTSLSLLASWLVFGALWSSFGPRRRNLDRVRRPRMHTKALLVVLLVGVVLWSAAIAATIADISGSLIAGNDEQDIADSFLVRGIVGWLAGLAALVVLVVDRVLVWSVVTKQLDRYRFARDPAGSGLVRSIGTGGGGLGGRLDRVPAEDGRNVVVYRGDKPFVGWGRPLRTWSITIPLEADDPAGADGARRRPPAFRLAGLYDHLAADLGQLRSSSPALSPSFRLRGLRDVESLMVPADDLVAHFREPAADLVLGDPSLRPALRLDPATVKEFAERPLEWMRYYRAFTVESWDRQLVVSLFVHVGADSDMLYFECTPCVLGPVDPAYSRIDTLSDQSYAAPLLDALGSAVVLPTTIFRRLAVAFRRQRPPGRSGTRFTADRYGALISVRELAADTELTDYLMVRDVDRYLTLMQDRIFSGTATFLKANGISSTRFSERAKLIMQNLSFTSFDQRGSSFTGGMFGDNNTVQTGPAATPSADLSTT